MTYFNDPNIYTKPAILKTDNSTGQTWGAVNNCGKGVHITQTSPTSHAGLGAHVTTTPRGFDGTSYHDYFDANGNYQGSDY